MTRNVPKPAYVPDNCPAVRVVNSMAALTPLFGSKVNCKVLPRRLSVDFAPLAWHMRGQLTEGGTRAAENGAPRLLPGAR